MIEFFFGFIWSNENKVVLLHTETINKHLKNKIMENNTFIKSIIALLCLVFLIVFCFTPMALMLASIFCTKVALGYRIVAFVIGAFFSAAGKPISTLFRIDLKCL